MSEGSGIARHTGRSQSVPTQFADPELAARVIASVAPDEVLGLARRLVAIPSYGPEHGWESAVADALGALLRSEGILVRRQIVQDGRENLIATLPGMHEGPPLLMLNGHMDTVPPSGSMVRPPFDAEVVDGYLWGRGAADMKGGLAAMVMVLVGLHRAGVQPPRPVMLAAVVMEEMGNVGTFAIAQAMASDGSPASYAVIGEPTELNLVIAHKGVDRYHITVVGRAAHGSIPERGSNAIVLASRLIQALDGELMRPGRYQAHPLLGTPSYNIGTIRGGVSRNTVPDRCTFEIEKRFLPGDDPAQIRTDIETIIEQTLGREKAELVRAAGFSQIPHGPLDIPSNHPLVRTLSQAVEASTGQRPDLLGWPAFTDGAVLQALGTPAVVCGPGSLAMAHADDERVTVAELSAAVQVYARLCIGLCRTESEVPPK